MIGYVMVGTNHLKEAVKFYDTVMEPLGIIRVSLNECSAAYAAKNQRSQIELYITKPFDGNVATIGNGSMVAFEVENKSQVDLFHITALQSGGINEGYPGHRPSGNDPYYAYARDPDGNKLCAYSNEQD